MNNRGPIALGALPLVAALVAAPLCTAQADPRPGPVLPPLKVALPPFGRLGYLLTDVATGPWQPGLTCVSPTGVLVAADRRSMLHTLDLATGARKVLAPYAMADDLSLAGLWPQALLCVHHGSARFRAGTLLLALEHGLYRIDRPLAGERRIAKVALPAECGPVEELLELPGGAILLRGHRIYRLDPEPGPATPVAGGALGFPQGTPEERDPLTMASRVTQMGLGPEGTVMLGEVMPDRLLQIGFAPPSVKVIRPHPGEEAAEPWEFRDFLTLPDGSLLGGRPLQRVDPRTGQTAPAWTFPGAPPESSFFPLAALRDGSVVGLVHRSHPVLLSLGLLSADDALQRQLEVLVQQGLWALDHGDPSASLNVFEALRELEGPGLDPASARAELGGKVGPEVAELIAAYTHPDVATRLRARLAREYLERHQRELGGRAPGSKPAHPSGSSPAAPSHP